MAFVIFPQMAPYVAAPDMRLCEPVSVIYRAVSGTSKRKLENGEHRLTPESHRPGTKASKLPARDSGTLASGVGYRCRSTPFIAVYLVVAVYLRLNFHRTVRPEPERASKGHG